MAKHKKVVETAPKKIDSKNRIVLSEPCLKALKASSGDYVVFARKDSTLIISKLDPNKEKEEE